MRIIKLLAAFFALAIFSSGCASVPSGTDASQKSAEWLPGLSAKLTKGIIVGGAKKIASIDFVDLQGRTTELGRYIAEQLSVEMVNETGISVVDRANFKSILAEHKLTMEGLINPENAKELGKFAGIDALLIGSVTILDGNVVLTVKAISTETAQIIAAAKAVFKNTPEMQQLANHITSAPSVPISPATAPVKTAAMATDSIATKDIGGLSITLKGVRPATTENGGQGIQFVLEFSGKDRVLVAIPKPKSSGSDIIKASLLDSLGQTWKAKQVSGLSYVSAAGSSNAEGIARSVMHSPHDSNPQPVAYYSDAWYGGFTEILPVQNKRATILFGKYGVPTGYSEDDSPTTGNKLADSYQLECELVICQGSSEKPEHCTAETIMFDDVALSKK